MDFVTFIIQMNSLRPLLPQETPPKNVPVLTVPAKAVINPDTITYNGEPIDLGPQVRMICTLSNGQVMHTGWYEVQKNNLQGCEPESE